MEKKRKKDKKDKIPFINRVAGYGAEEILKKIAESDLKETLLIKNDNVFGEEKYRNVLLEELEFFVLEEKFSDAVESLKTMFPPKEKESKEKTEPEETEPADVKSGQGESGETERNALKRADVKFSQGESSMAERNALKRTDIKSGQGESSMAEQNAFKRTNEKFSRGEIGEAERNALERVPSRQKGKIPEEKKDDFQIFLCGEKEKKKRSNAENSRFLLLEFVKPPCRLSFCIKITPYADRRIYPRECTRNLTFAEEETIAYCRFPSEEYLAVCFYEILKGLELLNDLSWYKEIYDILIEEPLEGRKVWESFGQLLQEKPIPSLEKRMDTIKSYENYGYMKKKWKSQEKREKEKYPQWDQVILLIGTFFTPIFEGVLRDEVFLGDWMPQIGRYLD